MSWVRVSLKETRERRGSMVSFRTAPAPKEANFFATENFSLKRKFGELDKDSTHVELQMERPLPLEWQQCLDLESGQIHFYNTRTRKRTCMDPREEQEEPETPKQGTPTMRLELELNLPYDSLSVNESSKHMEGEVQEMVAVACMRCHMLVMLCKASPTCPNCKFLHPLAQKDHGSLFKPGPGLSLLCCKD